MQTSTEIRPIRVMVVDDHKVVRNGLAALVKGITDMELVGVAANGSEAIHQCPQLKPDVVLMDLMMPGMSGIEATRTLHEACPESQVIILTSFGDAMSAAEARDAGAANFLRKDISVEELTGAIRSALGR